MRLPHWPKLSNNNKKTCLCCLSFFFPRSLKNNINTSEWTQMEQEEGTRKGQYNLATGWDISWEERANKQELATHLRTHAGKQAHSLEARVWLLVHKELRCNNFGWCTHGAEGLPGTSQVQKWCPHPSRGKRWKSELLFQARQELVCVIKCALATYVKTSCFVFLVICLSSYPNQGQQPKLKPFSCLGVGLYAIARTESHHLPWLPISAPRQHLLSTKLHRSVRLLSQTATQASGEAEHNHSSASSQQSQQQNCSCQEKMKSVAGQAQRCAISKLYSEALQPSSAAMNKTAKWVTCTGLGRQTSIQTLSFAA